MRIKYSRKFAKAFEKSPVEIQNAFQQRLLIFVGSPFEKLLNNHPLSGSFRGFRSINITGDWRAVFELDEDGVIFVDMGTHSRLYKK